jgi:cytochrome b pre-mRNA-processing protein 3
MILPLFRRPGRTIDALYGAIVAQARAAHFYAEMGVPDTVSGRFDMVLLHVVLVLRRLRQGEAAERALAQGLFDTFCRDMDHSLREMGISDQGLPKHMQRVGEAFYGRARAYEAALDDGAGEGALADALARNVYPDTADRLCAVVLAQYVRKAAEVIGTQPLATLADGVIWFPDPGFPQGCDRVKP